MNMKDKQSWYLKGNVGLIFAVGKKMYEEYSKPIYGVTIGKFKNEDGTYRKEYWTDNIVSTRVFNNDKLYWVPVPRWELNKSKLIDAAPYE